MQIAILGAGAMGCLYGGILAEKGNDVIFIDVAEATIQKINDTGVTLETESGKRNIKAKAFKAEAVLDAPDVIMLFTKTIYSKAALESVKHLLSDKVTVLTIQNGLGNKELIAEYVDERQIIIGMTGYPADLHGPADISSHGNSYTAIVAASGEVTETVRILADKITEAGLNCKVGPETIEYIWEKVCFNSAINSLCAETGLTVGEVGELGGKQLAYDIAHEGIEVANAYGVPAHFEKVQEMLNHAFSTHYNHKPSMLQDVLNHRRTEVDSLNGQIVSRGAFLKISTPMNSAMYQLMTMKQNKYLIK